MRNAVLTSRLRRLIDPADPWILGLRSVLRRIAASQSLLLTAHTTAGAQWIHHGARRLAIPTQAVLNVSETAPVDPLTGDRLLIAQADLVFVLGLRWNGNLHQLLRQRLSCGQTVILVDLPGLQSPKAAAELVQLGASVWCPNGDFTRPFRPDTAITAEIRRPTEPPSPTPSTDELLRRERICEVAPIPESEDWDFLTHTTRATPGPWPGESQASYFDCLLEGREEADHSGFATLLRIIAQRRLIASSRVIRGGHPVVSFTACPLAELPALHHYRRHRTRWDFEPYGFCIRRNWLEERGARPVYYGSDAEWNVLPPGDQPYFQLGPASADTDWTSEREWRHVGDLDLSRLSPHDALVFVPNYDCVQRLAGRCDWPVTLWPYSSPADQPASAVDK